MKKYHFKEDEAPPIDNHGVFYWAKENLFNSPLNVVLTIVVLTALFAVIPPAVSWVIVNADWVGQSPEACSSSGACWAFIGVRWDQFMYGFYPTEELWRPQLFYGTLAILVALLMYDKTPYKRWIGTFAISAYPILIATLLYGGAFGLEKVETHMWGGLLITLVIALVGIIASLPIGILLALGRRSTMPVIRSFSTIYIEIWRGVPLITVLFMASVMLPLFLAEGTDIDKLVRALIGVVMFASAYMAEVVRGGLQAIPKGQYEAADALGLTYWKKTILVILPQALKISIPSIVNTFISLFKDTSLVLIIGMFDVLGIGQTANTDPEWLGFATESYVFVAFVFWIFCSGMSRYSIWLEKRLHTGH